MWSEHVSLPRVQTDPEEKKAATSSVVRISNGLYVDLLQYDEVGDDLHSKNLAACQDSRIEETAGPIVSKESKPLDPTP